MTADALRPEGESIMNSWFKTLSWLRKTEPKRVDAFFGDDGPEDIPSVSPDDLRNVWTMMRDVPGQQGSVSIDNRMYESRCSPGANVMAVWSRASMLDLLNKVGVLSARLHNGEFDDAVFQVAATFPMKRMKIGVVHNGLPFDVKEFVNQIEHAG